MATNEIWWLADARTMKARPVEVEPANGLGEFDPDGELLRPVRRRDRGYLCLQFFRERWEAEADIVLQLANGDRPLNESVAATPQPAADPGED